jgi:hypothetical protein
LEEGVVFGHVGLVEDVRCEVIVYQPLPWDWETKDVEAVDVGEVLHLGSGLGEGWTLVFAVVGVFWTVVALY